MAELSKLGRYELRRILGKGAMGVVYEGFDPSLNRIVAVKTILKSVVTDEETAAAYSARFVREAKAAARLSHSNIVQVYDFGEQDDVAYLVMEFIQGHELRACFEARERFGAAETVRIMNELLGALEFAHEAGVIHRDVKPANVMLDAQRRVKLADFGVARLQDGNDRSKGGTMVGTPAFMSPEQISGGRVDRRTDVFSAGIVLYQLLTAEQPFKGEGAWTVAKQIMQDEPPRPSTIATRVSPAFDQIVNRALAKKPDQRYASAKEFAAVLQGALSGGSAQRGGDAEIEFWRSIQNSNDPAEFEVYLKEFPAGVYAELARIKISKLPRLAPGARSATVTPAIPLPVRDNAEVLKLAEETARLEAELARREAEFRKREAEAEAKQRAEEQTRLESVAKREARERERIAAEEKALRESIEQAKREAQAELVKREAQIRKIEAEADAKARAEAEERKKREVEIRSRAANQERIRREKEDKERREAEAKAKNDSEERARRDAAIARREAELRQHESDLMAREAAAPRRKAPLARIFAGVVAALAVAVGAHYWKTSHDEARLAELTNTLEAATKATQELSAARLRQEDLLQRVEVARLAETDARAKGDQVKLKELQEQTKKAEAEAQKQGELVKQREADAKKASDAAKVADAQKLGDAAKAAEKAAQEKAAQEKAAQARAAADLAAADKAAIEKAAAEKAVADKAAAEKLVAEKASAEKRAAEKAAAAKVAASSPEGVVPGRYAFRVMAGSGPDAICGRIDIREDINVRAGGTQSISGREFAELQILSAQDGSIVGTLRDNSSGRYSGDVKLAGRAIATTYAGTYEWRASSFASFVCTGQWTLVRKDAEKSAVPSTIPAIAPEGVLPGRYSFRLLTGTGSGSVCDLNGFEEDIEIGAGAARAISGRQFTGLQISGAQDGSIAATMFDGSNRRTNGELKLGGRATATGYAGNYAGLYQNFACTGQWTMVRK